VVLGAVGVTGEASVIAAVSFRRACPDAEGATECFMFCTPTTDTGNEFFYLTNCQSGALNGVLALN
jgi:hypothetical protein